MKYLIFAALVLALPCCKEPEPTPAVVDAAVDVDAEDVAVDVAADATAADVTAVDAGAVVTPVDATSTEQ